MGTIARLSVDLNANTAKFQKALQASNKKGKRFARDLKKSFSGITKEIRNVGLAATAMVGAFALIDKRNREMIDSLGKTAKKIGVTVEALQEWRFAAEQNGVSSGKFDMSLQRLTRRMQEVRQGSGVAKTAFRDMGISLTDSEGNAKSATRVMEDVADVFARTEDEATKVAWAFKLFDSEGVALKNMLDGGAESTRKLRAEFRELGVTLSTEQVSAVESTNDSLNVLSKIFGGISNRISADLAPTLKNFSDSLRSLLTAKDLNGNTFVDKIVDMFFRATNRAIFYILELSATIEDNKKMWSEAFEFTKDIAGGIKDAFLAMKKFNEDVLGMNSGQSLIVALLTGRLAWGAFKVVIGKSIGGIATLILGSLVTGSGSVLGSLGSLGAVATKFGVVGRMLFGLAGPVGLVAALASVFAYAIKKNQEQREAAGPMVGNPGQRRRARRNGARGINPLAKKPAIADESKAISEINGAVPSSEPVVKPVASGLGEDVSMRWSSKPVHPS